MRLQTKFLVLSAALGLTVVSALVMTVWSLLVIDRQITEPVNRYLTALDSIAQIRRTLDTHGAALRDQEDLGPEAFLALDVIAERVEELRGRDDQQGVTGRVLFGNITNRVQQLTELGEEWVAQREGDPAAAEQARLLALENIGRLRSLLIRVEGRLAENARASAELSSDIHPRLVRVQVIALAALVMLGMLGMLLVRRWVTRPVARLRDAAARIGSGEFRHRVDVLGRDELADLSREVNQMAAMVARLQDERVEQERLAAIGQMVRRIVHQLRNPLAGIRGLAEITREELAEGAQGAAAPSPESLDDAVEAQARIIASVDRFDRWMRELIDVSRPPSVDPAEVQVAPWLDRVIEAHVASAEVRRQSLVARVDPALDTAVFDPAHLEHGVAALVANAIEASPDGGSIVVTARLAPELHANGRSPLADATQQPWTIEVQDSGPGVDPEIRERIFSSFFTTKQDGSGIGLAVARQVAVAHGGAIRVLAPSEMAPGSDNRGPGGHGSPPGGPSDGPCGACFQLVLPRESERPNADTSAKAGQEL